VCCVLRDYLTYWTLGEELDEPEQCNIWCVVLCLGLVYGLAFVCIEGARAVW
jgi:hypothetical protein